VQNEELNDTDYNLPLIRDLENNSPVETTAPPAPNNPPWGGWAALGVWAMSIVFIVIFPNVFVLPYLAGQSVDILSDKARLTEFVLTDKTAVILQLAAIIPAHILTIVLAWLVVTKLRKYSFRKMLGWDWGGFKFWHAIAIFIFFYGLAYALMLIFGEPQNDFQKILASSRTAVYLVAFFATFTAPLVEEVVYRGVLYSAFQRRLGVAWAVVLVTVLFAAVHVAQYSSGQSPDYQTISVILLLSLALTLIRVHTKNLLPCIVLHTVFNGIQAIMLIAQPYLEEYLKTVEQKSAFFNHLLK
jgi:membrane protease YdiL (CAAX protease family)